MIFGNTNNARKRGRIAIILEKLCLSLCFRVQLPEIDVRHLVIAYAATCSQGEHGCSKEHAL